ncbi:MAG: cell division protein ZapA [Endomicrobium sp.]|jgi:hypothetical protein|nr:cell division protein ZapA [Endomicrobium sp.]
MIIAKERIMGREIELNIDNMNSDEFNNIISFINEQWLEVKKENVKIPDTQKIATLTTIKIAIKLFISKNIHEKVLHEYNEKIEKIISKLDIILN